MGWLQFLSLLSSLHVKQLKLPEILSIVFGCPKCTPKKIRFKVLLLSQFRLRNWPVGQFSL